MDTQQDIDRYVQEEDTHVILKERIDLLRKILPVIDTGAATANVSEVVGFFQDQLMKHFQLEEELIRSLRARHADTPDETMVIESILSDHRRIRTMVARLVDMAGGLNVHDREKKEAFVETVNALIEDALAHATREDQTFYPMARRRSRTGETA